MDDPVDKPERRSGTSYFPGAFGYFIIYVYTTGCSSAKCNRSDHHDLFDTPTLPGKVLPRKMTDHLYTPLQRPGYLSLKDWCYGGLLDIGCRLERYSNKNDLHVRRSITRLNHQANI